MCRKASLGVIVTKRQRIELGHTLGFIHEHQRPDRDQYVTINWALIEPGEEYNFDILPDSQLYTDYDFMSIMHYHGREFLRDDLRDDDHYSTIEPKDPYQGRATCYRQ